MQFTLHFHGTLLIRASPIGGSGAEEGAAAFFGLPRGFLARGGTETGSAVPVFLGWPFPLLVGPKMAGRSGKGKAGEGGGTSGSGTAFFRPLFGA